MFWRRSSSRTACATSSDVHGSLGSAPTLRNRDPSGRSTRGGGRDPRVGPRKVIGGRQRVLVPVVPDAQVIGRRRHDDVDAGGWELGKHRLHSQPGKNAPSMLGGRSWRTVSESTDMFCYASAVFYFRSRRGKALGGDERREVNRGQTVWPGGHTKADLTRLFTRLSAREAECWRRVPEQSCGYGDARGFRRHHLFPRRRRPLGLSRLRGSGRQRSHTPSRYNRATEQDS